MKSLTRQEQETIINFNKEDAMASIFTYEIAWQKHLEKNLKLKPIMDNGFGGREYQVDKRRIRPPRAPRIMSAAAKKKLGEQLRHSAISGVKSHSTAMKTAGRQAKA